MVKYRTIGEECLFRMVEIIELPEGHYLACKLLKIAELEIEQDV